MCVHVSLVPVIGVVGEQKTKPTQHSVATLRSLGLNPALLACRSSEPLQDSVREKLVSRLGHGGTNAGKGARESGGQVGGWQWCWRVGRQGKQAKWQKAFFWWRSMVLIWESRPALPSPPATRDSLPMRPPLPFPLPAPSCPPQASFCHVPAAQVLTMHDVSNIWRVPLMMQTQGAHETICRLLGLGGADKIDTSLWRQKIADKWDKLTEVRWAEDGGGEKAGRE